MPTKLKDLKITKVDFVDAGANPGANVLLFKHKDGRPAPTEASPTAEGGGEKTDNVLKRFFAKLGAAIGITAEEVDQAMAAFEKDATTFDEKVTQAQRRKTADEIWDFCWMLQDSLCSIFWDDELPAANKGPAMEQSLEQFVATVKTAIPQWAQGTPTLIAKEEPAISAERLEYAKSTHERLAQMIAKAEEAAPAVEPEEEPATSGQDDMKGETEMKIDKSKLTPEELAALEAIEKKAGVQEETPEGNTPPATEPAAAPAASPTTAAKAAEPAAPTVPADEGEDIYKGLHPTVAAELERLRKQADAIEERELAEVAKKYEIIGKKADELVPTLKSLKAAGGDAYDQMIAVLDASVAAVEKSGIFGEVGKKGNGSQSDAWASIEKRAEEIQKAAPTMTWNQAIDKACEQNPDLVHEYENNR